MKVSLIKLHGKPREDANLIEKEGMIRMNILYDHQIFVAQQYGGISRYFYEIGSRTAQNENVYLYEGWHINEYGLENAKNINLLTAYKRPMIPKNRTYF